MVNPFDGSGQLTSISALLALTGYLANIPVKYHKDVMKRTFEQAPGRTVLRFLKKRRQSAKALVVFAICDIILMVLILMLSVRIMLCVGGQPRGDSAIAAIDLLVSLTVALFAAGFLTAHAYFDSLSIWSNIREVKKVNIAIGDIERPTA